MQWARRPIAAMPAAAAALLAAQHPPGLSVSEAAFWSPTGSSGNMLRSICYGCHADQTAESSFM